MQQHDEATVETDWRFAAASVRGPGHVKLGLPNQDDFEIRTDDKGRVVAAVVSDGAGSAARSKEGSRACARIMSRHLLEIGLTRQDLIAKTLAKDEQAGASLLDLIAAGLEQVRASLDHTGKDLRAYAHTFSGLVMTPQGGLLVQIGDSPVLLARAEKAVDAEGNRGTDFFAETRILTMEKGEYANETHFVTQPDWRARLRPMTVPQARFGALLLMSDGAAEMAISRKQVFKPFIGPLMAQLLKAGNRKERDAVLKKALTDPRCDEVTADDKSLVVIYSHHWDAIASSPHISTLLEVPSPRREEEIQEPPSPPIPAPRVTRPDVQATPKWINWHMAFVLAAGLTLGSLLTLASPWVWRYLSGDQGPSPAVEDRKPPQQHTEIPAPSGKEASGNGINTEDAHGNAADAKAPTETAVTETKAGQKTEPDSEATKSVPEKAPSQQPQQAATLPEPAAETTESKTEGAESKPEPQAEPASGTAASPTETPPPPPPPPVPQSSVQAPVATGENPVNAKPETPQPQANPEPKMKGQENGKEGKGPFPTKTASRVGG